MKNVQHNFTIGEHGHYLDVLTGGLVEGVIKGIREDSDLVYLILTLGDGTIQTITARLKVRD